MSFSQLFLVSVFFCHCSFIMTSNNFLTPKISSSPGSTLSYITLFRSGDNEEFLANIINKCFFNVLHKIYLHTLHENKIKKPGNPFLQYTVGP